MLSQEQIDKLAPGDKKTQIMYRFHQLPKLVYVPWAWTDEDYNQWWDMSHLGIATPPCRESERMAHIN